MKYFSLILAVAIFAAGCDSSSIKTTKPKTDSDTESVSDSDTSDEDAELNDSNDSEIPDEFVDAVCGDGKVEGAEACEKDDVINCVEINEKLYNGGKAKCKSDCTGWDTETCDTVPMTCGNSEIEGIEVCDSNSIDCNTLNSDKYESGTAFCNLTCDGWDESLCVEYVESTCGDDKVEVKEVCEKDEVKNCVDIDSGKYESGKAKCLEDCTGWDTETCVEIEMPDEDIICTDECLKKDTVQCEGDKVMKCSLVSGCLKWVENKDCSDTGRFCADGDTIGSDSASNQREKVYKGTFIQASSNATVYEFSMDLDNTTGQPLVFAIYVSDTSDGDYTVLATRVVDEPGTGRKMYSSGPIKTGAGENVTITSGKFYIFGVAWDSSMTSYYRNFDGIFTQYKSETVSFGTTLGGTALENSYPLLTSISGTNKGLSTYRTKFNTGATSTEICQCNNTCFAQNATQCNANWIEECRADTYGCLDWYQDTDCDWKDCEFITDHAECVNNCVSECTLNNKQCNGNSVEKCTTNAVNGCTEWTFETDCSISMITPYCGKDGETSAKCYDTPQSSLEYIASEASTFYNSNTSSYFKGMYVLASQNAVVTDFKIHLQSPSGAIDVPFAVYEGSAESGSFTRVYRSVISVGANGYYGPTGMNLQITSGKYYLFGFYMPAGTGFYYTSGSSTAIEYPLKFGKSIGNESFSTATEPTASYTFDGPYTSSYRMYINSYLN